MDIEERIKQIDIENKIWMIYIGIIILSWYSNKLEKDKLNINEKDNLDLKWIKRIKEEGKIKELNRNILSSFINTIYVNEDGSIEIVLKYASQYENAIKALIYAK